MRRARPSLSLLPLAMAVSTLGCATSPSAGAAHGGEWVDLTHPFAADTVYWPTADGFRIETAAEGLTEGGFWYAAKRFAAAEHGGTHLDAPVHFAQGGQSADQVPIARLAGAAVVVDVSAQAAADRDHEVRIADLEAFEAAHGRIPRGAIVLLRTGWSRHWPDRERYLGTADRGAEAALRLHFPGLHPSAARWLVQERSVGAVGIDTASIDHGQSRLFHAHRELAKHDVPIFENVAALERLPATGAWVIALPMKISGGTGGPLRIVALVPR